MGNIIEADASRYHGKASDDIDWSLPDATWKMLKQTVLVYQRGGTKPRGCNRVLHRDLDRTCFAHCNCRRRKL
jgi:hypothetical protein